MPIYIRELFGMLRAEKLTAVDDDLEPVPSPKFKRIPKRHRFVESRVGQRDVGIARAEVLRCWPEPTTGRNVVTGGQKKDARASAMALVRDHLAKAHKAGKPPPSQNATEDELKDQGVPRQYLRVAYSEISEEQDQGAPTAPKN